MVFLNVYDDGCAHTEGEHRQWLADAGFGDVNLRTLPDGARIVSARKM